jgi:phosphatidylglycerophosphate synthase
MSHITDDAKRKRDVREAYADLARAQKPAYGTPAYSRFVNRPFGRALAAGATSLGLTPNQVSLLSAACSFGAMAVLASVPPGPAMALTVSGLLALGYALDSADGQVARLLGLRSRFGEWLDHMIDSAKTSTLHLAVLVQLARFTDLETSVLILPMAYLVADNVLFFGMTLVDQLRRAAGDTSTKTGGSLSVGRSLAILPSDYGALCLVFLALPWTRLFVTLYGLFCVGAILLLAAALYRWGNQLSALDRRAKA